MFDTSLWVASVEDVILSKLEWSRSGESYRQIEDVARLLTRQWDNLDQEYLREWVADLAVGEQWEQALRQAEIAKRDK